MTKIGDIITDEDGAFYAETALWCNENNAMLEEIAKKGDTRRFKVVEIPEKTDEEKKFLVRLERDKMINEIFWRVERYQTQEAAKIQTTDDKETYGDILLYLQYLRDYPDNQKTEWWEQLPVSFDEWRKK